MIVITCSVNCCQIVKPTEEHFECSAVGCRNTQCCVGCVYECDVCGDSVCFECVHGSGQPGDAFLATFVCLPCLARAAAVAA